MLKAFQVEALLEDLSDDIFCVDGLIDEKTPTWRCTNDSAMGD